MSKKKNFSRNCYKIVCAPLDTVLLVKKLKLNEERRLYVTIRNKIKTTSTPIDIESYKEYVLRLFLVDVEEVFKHFGSESDDGYAVTLKSGEVLLRPEIVDALYDAVTSLYPPFILESVCDDLNNELFVVDMGALFGEFVQPHHGPHSSSKIPALKQIRTLSDVRKIEKHITSSLVGQSEAVTAVMNTLKLHATGLEDFSSFFFIGPTGVGKTHLARLLGQVYSGNFYKINCAEFSGGHEYSKLIGSPPGYIGHTEKTILGEKAEKSNRWVFIFDEIEKANEKFYDFLLSLLDEGELTDNLGNTLDFSESIFVFTSNQGVQESKVGDSRIGFSGEDKTYVESQDEILASVKKKFNPEFLNRIDSFIFFKTLTEEEISKIVKLELIGVPIKKTKALVKYITENSFSSDYGARNVARFIKNYVTVRVAEEILNKKVPASKGAMYSPKIVKGKLTICNTVDFNSSTSASAS